MDNEMIYRVARAILETPNASDYEFLVAINAIKAMREPTEKMLYSPAIANTKSLKEEYQAMIDAVIND